MRTDLPPSVLRLDDRKAIELRQTSSLAYFMRLFEDSVPLASGEFGQRELDRLTMEMTAVQHGRLRLTYANRHVHIEIDERLWARVYDTQLMRLHQMAREGQGEGLTSED